MDTKTIKDNLKPDDLFGRYGRDEFVLLMKVKSCELIQSRCEALRHAIEISRNADYLQTVEA